MLSKRLGILHPRTSKKNDIQTSFVKRGSPSGKERKEKDAVRKELARVIERKNRLAAARNENKYIKSAFSRETTPLSLETEEKSGQNDRN